MTGLLSTAFGMDSAAFSILHVGRVVVGLIFLVSAALKLRNPASFRTVVFLLSGPLRRFYKELALLILCVEAWVGLALCLGILPTMTATIALGLMMIFDVVLAILKIGHPGIDCGCFGSNGNGEVNIWQFVRNAVMTLIVAALLFSSIDPMFTPRSITWLQVTLAAGLAGFLVVISAYKHQ